MTAFTATLLRTQTPLPPLHKTGPLSVCITLSSQRSEDLLLALHTTTSNQCCPCRWSPLLFLFLIRLYFLWLLSFFLCASAFLEKRLKFHCHFQPQSPCPAGPAQGSQLGSLAPPAVHLLLRDWGGLTPRSLQSQGSKETGVLLTVLD